MMDEGRVRRSRVGRRKKCPERGPPWFRFRRAADVFAGDYIETKSGNRDFGGLRYVAIGSVEGLIVTVIWTPRGMKRRIISVHPSSRKERDIYRVYRDQETLRAWICDPAERLPTTERSANPAMEKRRRR
ncbi:MAG: BrnT family toxin [Candidatus Baltobacteraceae bacterium]